MIGALGMLLAFVVTLMVWPQGWPFWPIFTSAAGLLFLVGLYTRQWQAPLIVLCGYGAMRFLMTYATDPAQEHGAFLIWVTVALGLATIRAWLPAIAYFLSGATYPIMQLFGFPIEYLGLAPIVAELFAMAALISIGGGVYGGYRTHSRFGAPVRLGFNSWLAGASLGVAARSR